MKKFFAKKVNNQFVFENEELAHFNVVRCHLGEEILCFDGSENEYLCKVDSITKKQAIATIVQTSVCGKNPKVSITVFQGLVKGEKMDLIVQKLTELGISNLITFESEFAVAKANNNKIDRLNKISYEACKQCGRSIPINISSTINFNQMINTLKNYDIVLFANEKNTPRLINQFEAKNNIALIVGSEGGFSDAEIQKIYSAGAMNFGLGSRILRAETACIAMASIVGFMVGV